jgi:hypothetical protein
MYYEQLNQLTTTENRPVFFDVTSEDITSGSGIVATDKQMLIRENMGGTYLSVVNKTYEVVRNQDILMPFQMQLIDRFDPSVLEDIEIKDHVLKDGRVCYSEYILPKVARPVETSTGHKTECGLRWIMKNSFDGSSSVVLYGGLIDFFCTNGMITGTYDVMKARHTKSFEVSGFLRAFDDTLNKNIEMVDKYQEYADTKVTSSVQVMDLFNKLASTRKLLNDDGTEAVSKRSNTLPDRLFAQYTEEAEERGHNVFSVASALTHYASHGDQEDRFKIQKRADQSTLFKRQEQVARWMNSKVWNEYLEVA